MEDYEQYNLKNILKENPDLKQKLKIAIKIARTLQNMK
jgi:hypothetical protein